MLINLPPKQTHHRTNNKLPIHYEKRKSARKTWFTHCLQMVQTRTRIRQTWTKRCHWVGQAKTTPGRRIWKSFVWYWQDITPQEYQGRLWQMNTTTIGRYPKNKTQTITTNKTSWPGGGGLTGEAVEKFTNERMTMDARRQITTYLLVAQPLLADLPGLFDEMNMDDPTRV